MLRLIAMTFVLAAPVSVRAQIHEECDYSSYHPLYCDHCLLGAALKRVAPEYPVMAQQAGVEGDVKVTILVERSGRVVAACAKQGHPLLRAAAEKAATQWRFQRNFGLMLRQKKRYLVHELTFHFVKGRAASEEQPN